MTEKFCGNFKALHLFSGNTQGCHPEKGNGLRGRLKKQSQGPERLKRRLKMRQTKSSLSST